MSAAAIPWHVSRFGHRRYLIQRVGPVGPFARRTLPDVPLRCEREGTFLALWINRAFVVCRRSAVSGVGASRSLVTGVRKTLGPTICRGPLGAGDGLTPSSVGWCAGWPRSIWWMTGKDSTMPTSTPAAHLRSSSPLFPSLK